MSITVQVNDLGGWSLPAPLLEVGVRAVFTTEGMEEGEVSLTFMGDEEIRALNLEYLEKDGPTDVIAFTLFSPGEPVLGDVYLGYDQIRRQAAEVGVSLEEELLRVAIHGALHLLGHDHPDGPERIESPMFIKQETLLKEILTSHSPGETP